MVSEIKNIILDWGGIIIGLDENDCIEAFKKIGAPEDYFEKVFLSHELGVMKPDERIYRKVLDMANIQAENTLFIDDNYNNCEVAKECGINTMNVSALDEVLLYYGQVVY